MGMLFTAKHIRIIPPDISKNIDGSFLKKLPSQKPPKDMKNDAAPIIKAEISIELSVNFKFMPEANASMLVAMPNIIRHFKSKHFNSSSFAKNASIINFAPKMKNIEKTIIDEYGSIYFSIKSTLI